MKKQIIFRYAVLIIAIFHITPSNSQSWLAVGSGVNKQVLSLTTDTTNNLLYAGGAFTTAGGISANYIAKWNGTKWDSLGGGVGGQVETLVLYNKELYAGGYFAYVNVTSADSMIYTPGIAKWNGTKWSSVGGGMNTSSSVFALGTYNGNLYAGGGFTMAGKLAVSNIAQWDGIQWSTLGTGTNSTVGALCVYNGELYVAGYFTTAGGISANYIAKWNGSKWSSVGTGMDNYVRTLSVYKGELYAGGLFTTAGGISANRIAKWNGTKWSNVGTGIGGATVNTLSVYNGELIVGGQFSNADGNAASNIAKWNGSKWSLLGTGVDQSSACMANYNGELIVGGGFSTAGTTIVNNIARWNDGVGIQNENGNSQRISVYPNPAQNRVSIAVGSGEKVSITVYDIIGNVISDAKQNRKGDTYQIDLSTQQAGMYFIKVQSEKGSEVRKVVVVK